MLTQLNPQDPKKYYPTVEARPHAVASVGQDRMEKAMEASVLFGACSRDPCLHSLLSYTLNPEPLYSMDTCLSIHTASELNVTTRKLLGVIRAP